MNNKYKTKKSYQYTPKGVLNIIYRNQLLRQKRKGIKVDYTYEEFKQKYLFDSKFLKLYKQWVLSNYDTNKKTSFDRIDSKKEYSFDNLQVVTWEENNKKGRQEKKKAVDKYDINNNFLKSYNSISDASKDVGVYKSNISACCKGKTKTSGGFIWKYKAKE